MKSMASVLGAAVLVLGAGVANAGSNWIGLSGGAGIPTGDYHNAAGTGWHVGATGTHMLDQQWGIGADLGYHAWGGSSDANQSAVTLFGSGSKFSWEAIQITGHGVMAIPTKSEMKPYVTAGVGLYDVTSRLKSPSGDSHASKSEMGFNFGAGFDLSHRDNMKWGVAGNYHIIPASNDLGSDVDFFSLGLNVLWGMSN